MSNRQQATGNRVRYRVLTDRLRVQRGPGRNDLVVERPFKVINAGKLNKRKVYADSAENPTTVSFDSHCRVNIPQLLRIGAIAEIDLKSPPARPGESEGGALGHPPQGGAPPTDPTGSVA